MTSIVDALQNVLTKGLDAAAQVETTKLQVNDPTGYTTGPNGQRVPTGQGASFATSVASLPAWVWVAGLGLVALVIAVPLLRR